MVVRLIGPVYSVDVSVGEGEPYQFRLLADGLLGYAWPKWVRSGEKSEFRVHAVEAYKLGHYRHLRRTRNSERRCRAFQNGIWKKWKEASA